MKPVTRTSTVVRMTELTRYCPATAIVRGVIERSVKAVSDGIQQE